MNNISTGKWVVPEDLGKERTSKLLILAQYAGFKLGNFTLDMGYHYEDIPYLMIEGDLIYRVGYWRVSESKTNIISGDELEQALIRLIKHRNNGS